MNDYLNRLKYVPAPMPTYPWPNPDNEEIERLKAKLKTAKADAWNEGYRQACADNGDEWCFETDGAVNPYGEGS